MPLRLTAMLILGIATLFTQQVSNCGSLQGKV